MNILITGAFGFVGTNLSEAIKKADWKSTLIAIDVQETKNHAYDEYYSWEELAKVDWTKIDAIIHLAGKAHDTKNNADEKVYFSINVGLTKKIVGHFKESNASKFIFFSSVKAVADTVDGEILTEEYLPNPKTAYGKSKLEAEKYILNQQLPENKKVYILRPCMIHGPGNKGNLNLLYKLVQKGIPWPLGSFENERSFTSINNLSFIIERLLQDNVEQGIYQVADDQTLSTNKLIQLIAEARGGKPTILHFNKNMLSSVARFGDLLHLPLNSERLKKLTESYIVSNDKIKKTLKINTLPETATEGMKKTLTSFS